MKNDNSSTKHIALFLLILTSTSSLRVKCVFYFSFIQILQQPESICCLPQQQQQQQQQKLFLCTDPTSMQDFICSSSATMQPTIISQMPVFNAPSANLSSQQFICISEPSVQPSASIIIQQQPQIQAQPIQIIQAPQTQPAQYLQISSATPQIIQTIQAPAGQNQQAQPIIQAFQGINLSLNFFVDFSDGLLSEY
jgi:hypothetical protein